MYTCLGTHRIIPWNYLFTHHTLKAKAKFVTASRLSRIPGKPGHLCTKQALCVGTRSPASTIRYPFYRWVGWWYYFDGQKFPSCLGSEPVSSGLWVRDSTSRPSRHPHTQSHTLSLFCSSICSISYRSVAFQLYTVIGLLTFSSLLVISPLTHYCCYYSLFSCSPVTKIVNGRKKTSLQDSADVFILHLCKYHCTTYQWCVLYRHTYSKLPLTSYTHSVLFYWFILVPSLEELCLLKLSEDKIDSSNLPVTLKEKL